MDSMLMTFGGIVLGAALAVVLVLWVVPWWQQGRTRRDFRSLERRRRREYARSEKARADRQFDDAQA